MQIVVVDGYALNPGDISWDELKKIGSLKVYDNTVPDELFPRIEEAEVVITNKAVIPDQMLDQLPKLKYVGVTATGVNIINLDLARKKNIVVTNAPDYGTHSVAQHVFALILEFSNNVGRTVSATNKGRWQEVGQWSYADRPLKELKGKCLGIIGMGAIGQQVATIGAAFGMSIIYHTPTVKDVPYQYASVNEVFTKADFLSLNCPLNPATEHMVNARNLSLMKPEAILINTGRGQLINEQALVDALQNGVIAGAGLDVLSEEPPGDNPLIGAPNCIITPHQAWATREARQRLLDIVVDNLKCFLNGEMKNVVN